MAHHKSALKRIKTSEVRRLRNRQYSKTLRTLTKSVRTAENKEEAEKALNKVLPLLDKYATKGIIHRNKAANQKSKLTLFVNNLS